MDSEKQRVMSVEGGVCGTHFVRSNFADDVTCDLHTIAAKLTCNLLVI